MTKTTTTTLHIATMQTETIAFYDPDTKTIFDIGDLKESQLTTITRNRLYCFIFELNMKVYFAYVGRYSESGRYAGFMGNLKRGNEEVIITSGRPHHGNSYKNGGLKAIKDLLNLYYKHIKQQGRDNEI